MKPPSKLPDDAPAPPPPRRSATRRSFFRAVGAGVAGLPFYRLLEDNVARAAGETLPLRFIGIYHPHGVAAELWAMKSGDTESNFNITYADCSLQPFDDAATYGKSWKSMILPVEGVDLLSNANGHDSAGAILTGSRIDASASRPQNSSLDQFLAVEKGLGKMTPVTSIQLGVGSDDTKAGETLSFGTGGVALPKIIDPVQAYKVLFANIVTTTDPAAQAEAMRKQRQGKSLVDFLAKDCRRLQARLAPPEKAKLEEHLTALADLEKQFAGMTSGGGAAMCPTPTMPSASAFPKLKRYNGGEPYFDAITNAFVDLVAQAFACDVTRFVTLFLGDLSYSGNPLSLPIDNHGEVAHTYNGSPLGSDGAPVGNGDPATWTTLAKFNKYSYGKIARLMQRLDSYGVLGSTLIYASSDMGNPARHSTRNVPTLLAGGANGFFRMGRRLRLQADCPASSPWCAPGDANFKGATNNHVLVSIAQAFGVSINSFGTQPKAEDTTGPVAGLT
jgi:hypothetical protein